VTERAGVDPDGPVLDYSELAPDDGQVDVRALMGVRYRFGIEIRRFNFSLSPFFILGYSKTCSFAISKSPE